MKINTPKPKKTSKQEESPSPSQVMELNPRSQAVKTLEMTLRRSIPLARLCALHHESEQGKAQFVLPDLSHPAMKKLAKMIEDPPYKSPYLSNQEYWAFAYGYWISGGHDRNAAALYEQLPEENRKRVDKARKEVEKIER